jgi:drug/metabolite transporter (DMT)-like permease
VATFALLYWLLARVRAVSAALIDLTLPLLTLVEGWAFYGERVTPSVVLGALVVVTGLTLTLADASRAPRREGRYSVRA